MVFDYPGQERQAARPGRRRPAGAGDRVLAQAPPRRGRRAAGLQGRQDVGRRALRRHQRLPEGGDRRRLLGQGLPDLERDRDRRARARGLRPGARLAAHQRKRAITRAVKETAYYLGNTPGGVPRLLHRPARLRRLPRRPRARPEGDRRGAGRRARRPAHAPPADRAGGAGPDRRARARARRGARWTKRPSRSSGLGCGGSSGGGVSRSGVGSAGTTGSSGTAGVAGSERRDRGRRLARLGHFERQRHWATCIPDP